MANVTLATQDGSVTASFTYDPKISQAVTAKSSILDFDGRTYPVAYFGEGTSDVGDYEFLVDSSTQGSQWENLREMVDGPSRGAPLVFTDAFGQSFNVIVDGPTTITRVVGGTTPGQLYRVRVKLSRVE